ncbi:hypothetical protein ACWDKQ_13185 [Saccharopolyspora sp. NPDC000995]
MTALVAVGRRNRFRYSVVLAGLVLAVAGVLLAVLCLGAIRSGCPMWSVRCSGRVVRKWITSSCGCGCPGR